MCANSSSFDDDDDDTEAETTDDDNKESWAGPYLQRIKLSMALMMEVSSKGGLPKWASTDAGFVGALMWVRGESNVLRVGDIVVVVAVVVDGGRRMLLRSSLKRKK